MNIQRIDLNALETRLPKYLVKFGEKEYMESLTKGNFYFSHAKRFAEIEDELVRGQGDKLEGKAKFHATKVKITDLEDESVTQEINNFDGDITLLLEKVASMPIFCMTGLYDSDFIEVNQDNQNNRVLKKEIINTINSHFPNADTAVFIKNPKTLLDSLEREFNRKIVYDSVKYMNMYPVGMDWVKFVHNNQGYKEGKTIQYTMTTELSHRMLLCKDNFFREEKEFRLILPNELIESPKVYRYTFDTEFEVIDIDSFLNKVFDGDKWQHMEE